MVVSHRVLERLDVELAVARRRNFMRFSDARLHAESSRNMYSEHGFDALMRAVLMHGCQSLIGRVVLHAGIAADPGGVGHLAHEVARLVGLDGLPLVT